MSEKLKPCPFCGRDDLKIVRAKQSVKVRCNLCIGTGPDQITTEQAIAAWNRRAEIEG